MFYNLIDVSEGTAVASVILELWGKLLGQLLRLLGAEKADNPTRLRFGKSKRGENGSNFAGVHGGKSELVLIATETRNCEVNAGRVDTSPRGFTVLSQG